MSGSYESELPEDRVERLIAEMQKRLEHLAQGRKRGASPEELLPEVVGLHDFSWRLFGHYDAQITSIEPRKPNPFGFGPESSN